MRHIFSIGLVTGKNTMGSGEPLDTPMPNGGDTQESETIIPDGPKKVFEHDRVLDRKRKRADLMEELSVFTSMIEVVKEVATAIREMKPLDVHPSLYCAVMGQGGFTPEALMCALSH